MKKYLFVIVVGLISILGCQNSQTQSSDKDTEDRTVKVGYLNMITSLTHFVAIEKGYYKEQKLEIIANPLKTSNLMAQELVSGHIDVGIEFAITTVLKQLELTAGTVKIFSTSIISTDDGFDAIVVKNDSPVQKLEDLAGKKVGGFPGTTAKVLFSQLFETQFPDLAKPEFVKLTPNLHIQSLQTGDIDALFAYEPVLSTGIVSYGFRKIFPSVYGTQFSPNPTGVGVVNNSWFEKNPEVAKAFLAAIDKSIDFIQNNPKEAKSILAKATNIDEAIAQNMNALSLSKSNEINLENLNEYLALLLELDEISVVPAVIDICIPQN
jgi:ABC-type nitrate/sulfonate/bicarbonate transport system substrate-binding protein